VNVTDSDGRLLTNLSAQNFSASVNHRLVSVVSVKPNPSPPRVFLVIDTGSIDDDFWNYYLDVADWFAKSAPPASYVGLAVFRWKIETLIPLSQNLEQITDELQKLRTRYEGIVTKTDRASPRDSLDKVSPGMGAPREGDAIYILTDRYYSSPREFVPKIVAEELLNAGIRVFALSINERRAVTTWEGFVAPFPPLLDGLPGRSGGSAVSISLGPHGLLALPKDKDGNLGPDAKLIQQQFWRIFNYLALDIELPMKLEKTGTLKLKTGGLHVLDPIIAYPQVLAPCVLSSTSRPAS
jgi:hypothetical protein